MRHCRSSDQCLLTLAPRWTPLIPVHLSVQIPCGRQTPVLFAGVLALGPHGLGCRANRMSQLRNGGQ